MAWIIVLTFLHTASEMSVIHLNTNDISGGAARAANRLHLSLLDLGIGSSMFVRNKKSAQGAVVQLKPERILRAQVRRAIRYACIRSDFFPRYVSWPRSTGTLMNDDRSRFAGEVFDQLPSADIIHLHWIAGFVDIPSFFKKTDSPIVWTLHDMNPLTGGCHYNFGCRRFEDKCGLCPRLDSSSEDDPSRRSWERKHAAFHEEARRDQIHIVSPSRWLKQQAEQSSLLGEFPIYHIPNGIDHTLFRPLDSEGVREELGIPSTRNVLLFVSHSRSNDRKGFGLLLDALADADFRNVTLLSVGGDKPEVPDGFSHVHAGYIEDDQKLARLYSLADIFVIPSRQDNLPNTVLESMACETPVVGFDTGGIPDMVRPGETGWLAEAGNVRSLRNVLEDALADSTDRQRKAIRCREVVEEEYTLERQAQEYVNLYTSILEGEPG